MTRTHGSKDFWLAGLRADGAAFRAAVGTPGGLSAPVPSCPGWHGEELVHHLGGLYQWVGAHVSRGVTGPPDPDLRRPSSEFPTGEAALPWFDLQLAALVAKLEELDPATPAWNWAPQPKQAAFWYRRMAHETAIHRWDAQMAVGLTEPIEAKLAADGVDEVLDTWLPAGRRKGPADRTGVVQLVAEDVERYWYVRLRGEGGIALLDTDTLLDTDDPHARALGQGSASDLELALYGRVPFDILDIEGDPTLLEALRTG